MKTLIKVLGVIALCALTAVATVFMVGGSSKAQGPDPCLEALYEADRLFSVSVDTLGAVLPVIQGIPDLIDAVRYRDQAGITEFSGTIDEYQSAIQQHRADILDSPYGTLLAKCEGSLT